MEQKLEAMVEKIKNSFGAELKSILLYGSKAVDDEAGKRSDYNVLIIFNEANFENMKKLAPITADWIKAGSPPPQVFGKRMFEKSDDVFPIEFLDIKAHHKVLFGEDPLENVKIDMSNLRHQCEFELKSKLLSLRQGYLASGGKQAKLKAIMAGSISSVLVIFKHTVRLLGQEPPDKKIDSLEILAKKIAFSPEVFVSVARLKNEEKDVLKADMEHLMSDYLTQIEKVVNFIDDLN